MATAFTHGFTAAFLVPFAPKSIPRVRLVIVLMVMSVIPDIDVVAFLLNIPYSDPLGHRGLTHSIPFACLMGLTVATLFYRFTGLFTRDWIVLFVLFSIAMVSHGVLDALTDAGLGVGFFIPFDNSRYFFPWRPLATSPIGITAFFNGQASYILVNEFIWVWLPLLFCGVIGLTIRRQRGRKDLKLPARS